MANLIAPIAEKLKSLLKALVPAPLPGFATVKLGDHGVMINSPSACVLPLNTNFPDQGEGNGDARNQVHGFTLRLGIIGADPEELVTRCMQYVAAVDAAIWTSPLTDWPDYVKRVFVAGHEYGPMFQKQGGGVAYWPELYVRVEVEEVS